MKFLVLGAGDMGYAMVYDLIRSPKVESVVVADKNVEQVKVLKERLQDDKIVPVELDVSNQEYVLELMSNQDVTVSCLPHHFNYQLTKLALQARSHFCDLGNNREDTEKIFLLDEVASDQGVSIVPNLGFAPGLVSILAVNAARKMDQLYEIKLRAGRLAQEPEDILSKDLLPQYRNSLAVESLLRSYTEPCKVIKGGKLLKLPALSEPETMKFPHPIGEVESFNVSLAGLNLMDKFRDQVQNLDYKTIRPVGHLERMNLLFELELFSRQKIKLADGAELTPAELTAFQMNRLIPRDVTDMMLLRVTVTGMLDKEPLQNIWELIDFGDQSDGLSALSRMNTIPASIIAQMIAREDIKKRGVLHQEEVVPVKLFLAEIASRGLNLKLTERAPVHDS